ncbi:hypothetical protein SAMN05216236_1302 [Sedimentitalea nanhaiensis]|uniref:Uncharacterized protein n=1 Tax=Sedimentitalea nanhaiensis TaxID=999627 RepID=A0A1I7DL52_9RHOB|nr:hypothetical protein SAMN05216236_1302 [Sedimentitalea nanhaiensis]
MSCQEGGFDQEKERLEVQGICLSQVFMACASADHSSELPQAVFFVCVLCFSIHSATGTPAGGGCLMPRWSGGVGPFTFRHGKVCHRITCLLVSFALPVLVSVMRCRTRRARLVRATIRFRNGEIRIRALSAGFRRWFIFNGKDDPASPEFRDSFSRSAVPSVQCRIALWSLCFSLNVAPMQLQGWAECPIRQGHFRGSAGRFLKGERFRSCLSSTWKRQGSAGRGWVRLVTQRLTHS